MANPFRHFLGACVITLLPIAPAAATTLTTLYSVQGSSDGAAPQAALINVGGTYYGTTTFGGTPGYGTVFSINPATGAETVLYTFAGGDDGANPQAALLNIGGILYGTTNSGGTSGEGTVFSINPSTGAETVLHSFAGHADGANPDAELIKVGGTLYGTTYEGGTGGGEFGGGTLFSINLATGAETVLHSFGLGNDGENPLAALLDVRGTLYGTTSSGGAGGTGDCARPLFNGCGTVFSFDPATGAETVLHSFGVDSDGEYPAGRLINVSDTLYGTTAQGGSAGFGTVFSIIPATGAETVIHNFAGGSDGIAPEGGLINISGAVYGATTFGGTGSCSAPYTGCGTVFSVNTTTGAEAVLYSFAGGSDGTSPEAGLISADNTFYGTTYSGGAANAGTVFSINPATESKTALYSFTGATSIYTQTNALQNVGGTLFLSASGGGSANIGDIVSIDPSDDSAAELYTFPNETVGAYPEAALINAGSTLYGTTAGGGSGSCSGGCGTVFSINPATGAQTRLYSFAGGHDGIGPAAALIDVNNVFYGTTSSGGKHNKGTVFSIDPASGAEKVLYSFGASGTTDGASPEAELINFGGTLYGTTAYGGTGKCQLNPKGCGTVFSVDPATGDETVLYNFQKTGGSHPRGALINVGGTLYGTAFQDSRSINGTVFAINPATGAEKIVHGFKALNDGAEPQGALINVGGTLYGTTVYGGTGTCTSNPTGCGTVFSINPATGAETVLYSFTDGSDGAAPASALVSIGSALYGTTNSGGAANRGTVFRLVP